MEKQKYCIICGNENFTRSKNFCSRKCRDVWYNKQYYLANKEKILEKNTQWAKDNKQELYEKRNTKYANDLEFKEKMKEATKSWYAKNTEYAKSYQKEYRRRKKYEKNIKCEN